MLKTKIFTCTYTYLSDINYLNDEIDRYISLFKIKKEDFISLNTNFDNNIIIVTLVHI